MLGLVRRLFGVLRLTARIILAISRFAQRQVVGIKSRSMTFIRWYIRKFHTERRVTYDKSGRSKLPGLGFETAVFGVHMILAVGHLVVFLQG